jgi:hypothetical protein
MGSAWEPAEYLNLSEILMRPVESGLWRLHETFDGTYTGDDLLDILELLDVRVENRLRAEEYRERKANAG